MMSRATLDLWVGFFVALGCAALIFLAMKVGNFSGLNSAPTYVVEAPFDNIGGLKVRAPVKSAGVVVGRVAGIRFDAQRYCGWFPNDASIVSRYHCHDPDHCLASTVGLSRRRRRDAEQRRDRGDDVAGRRAR